MSKSLPKNLPRAEILAAAKRYQAFHNSRAHDVTVEKLPEAAFLLGRLQAVTYSVIENGKEVIYHHEFDAPPGLAISYDGAQAFILAGGWTFTKRGFEG